MEMNMWLLLHFKMCSLKMLASFKEVSDEEKFLLFQDGKMNGKWANSVLLVCLVHECGLRVVEWVALIRFLFGMCHY